MWVSCECNFESACRTHVRVIRSVLDGRRPIETEKFVALSKDNCDYSMRKNDVRGVFMARTIQFKYSPKMSSVDVIVEKTRTRWPARCNFGSLSTERKRGNHGSV
jgi:hypothetical protein